LYLHKQLLNFRPVELRFSPTEDDWMNAARGVPRAGRVWNTFQFGLTFVPLFILGIGLAVSGLAAVGWFCMGSSIVVALAAYEVPRARQRRRFRTAPRAKEEKESLRLARMASPRNLSMAVRNNPGEPLRNIARPKLASYF
jgi:hypothetical protein